MDKTLLSDELVSPMLNFLVILRDACGGDLEKNLILMTIAERTIAHPAFRSLTGAQRSSAETGSFPTRGVNVRSIADSSGIPRETVRRKVGELVQAGWIAQGDQTLHFTPRGYEALTPARNGLENLALRFQEILNRRDEADGAG